jgi:hypothetical protein
MNMAARDSLFEERQAIAPGPDDTARPDFERLRARRATHTDLRAFFDALEPVTVTAMLGLWRGGAWRTGTRFDGLLEQLGWYGKQFRGPNAVDALLFTRPTTVLGWLNRAIIWPLRLPGHRGLFRHPLGRARLREVRFGGRVSAAMVYDWLPIIDHFRRVDDRVVMGLMDLRGRRDCALFFWLERLP